MVTNKKKKPLSLEDKSKLATVYHLLQWKGLNASAAALAKEADLTIPSQKPERQSQEVLWSRLPNSPGEESESDSDSSESDSDGDSDSSSSERTTIVQNKKLPNAIKKEESSDSSSTSSSSDSDSDSDDEDEETSGTSNDGSSSSSSDDDESSDSDSSMSDVKTLRAGNNLKRKRPLSSSSESTSSSESESESESSTSDSSSSSDESSSSSSDDEPPKKVPKTQKKTSATQPPLSPTLSKTLSPPAQRHVASPPQKSSSPSQIHPDRQKIHNGDSKRFSRIKTDIEVHPGVSSNAYNAGASNYGAKAHMDLIVTRGDGFRKEKQKKKRGSYKGGVIDFEARSFKFAD